ncbi:MAG: hypothetical protein SPJ19_04650 [Candidatus Borkfalkiaceae bacterium]|nr:hypothetical protein [Christensenellaceae bacterium]
MDTIDMGMIIGKKIALSINTDDALLCNLNTRYAHKNPRISLKITGITVTSAVFFSNSGNRSS